VNKGSFYGSSFAYRGPGLYISALYILYLCFSGLLADFNREYCYKPSRGDRCDTYCPGSQTAEAGQAWEERNKISDSLPLVANALHAVPPLEQHHLQDPEFGRFRCSSPIPPRQSPTLSGSLQQHQRRNS